MDDPMLHGDIVAQRRQDMLRQARLHHIRRTALGNRDMLGRRWLAMVADLLIASGTQIKHRCERAAQARTAAVDTPVMDVGWDRL